MLIVSCETIGAMASKKKRCSSPLSSIIFCDIAGEVSGPEAMMVNVGGISVTSSRIILIRG